MFVQKLDHVNIRVKDPEATIAFFMDVLLMGRHDVMTNWVLDMDGNPVIHVGIVDAQYPSDAFMPFDGDTNGGPVHHIALKCQGYDAVRARLEERALQYCSNLIPQVSLRQLFVPEPGGALMELNFFEDEDGNPVPAA